jgi:shikimate kinase
VLVNATPVGTAGDDAGPLAGLPLDGLVVLDAPYADAGRETALVRLARAARGTTVVGGLDLLLAQAIRQAEALHGCPVERDVLAMALRPATNLVLVGLRGAGKTTVGRLVARTLGRPFVDTDEEVLRTTGLDAGRWIRERGLERFREVEAVVVDRLRGRRGLVVALGGGALETPRNGAALREGSVGVFLDVLPETAARRASADGADRPPLVEGTGPQEESRALLERRASAWRSFAVETVDAEEPAARVAEVVARRWVSRALRTT